MQSSSFLNDSKLCTLFLEEDEMYYGSKKAFSKVVFNKIRDMKVGVIIIKNFPSVCIETGMPMSVHHVFDIFKYNLQQKIFSVLRIDENTYMISVFHNTKDELHATKQFIRTIKGGIITCFVEEKDIRCEDIRFMYRPSLNKLRKACADTIETYDFVPFTHEMAKILDDSDSDSDSDSDISTQVISRRSDIRTLVIIFVVFMIYLYSIVTC